MMRVFDSDKGFARIGKVSRELQARRRKVTVGVHGKDNARAGGDIDNVGVGTIHEYGSEDGRIPQRSFIGATIDENGSDYTGRARQLLGDVIEGRKEVQQALGLLGEVVKRDVIQRINDGIEPELAQSTIDAKGSSKPLIDTGSLKQSINYVVES